MKHIISLAVLLSSFYVQAEPIRSIVVKGEGESEVLPDYVKLSASISEEGKDLARVKLNVDERMRQVVETIDRFSIERHDVSFGGVGVEQSTRYDRNENEIPAGFIVERSLEIKLRNLADYEKLVQGLVTAGADSVADPESEVDDKNVLKQSALQKAAQNAHQNALAIAATLGVKLGSPIEVGEDQLLPRVAFEQASTSDRGVIEEIVVTARKSEFPTNTLLFVPSRIKTSVTVWVRFEILANFQ